MGGNNWATPQAQLLGRFAQEEGFICLLALGAFGRKSEIRGTKSETNSNYQIEEMTETSAFRMEIRNGLLF